MPGLVSDQERTLTADLLMRSEPKISVVIPTYNSAKFVGASLESALQQSCDDYEIIVVDDGSTDNTASIVRAFPAPVRYVAQTNQGPAAARNTGIREARGEYVCFLDADDSWKPNKLRTQLDFMDAHPHVGLVFADEEEFDEGGVHCASLVSKSRFFSDISGSHIVDGAFHKLLEENFIPTSTVMIRRQCFERTGLFDVGLKGPEDRDLWSRIAVSFPVAYIPLVLGRKRVVPGSVSHNVETTLRSRIILWTKAHKCFPELAPRRRVNPLLAATHGQLAFVLLDRDQLREARSHAARSIMLSRKPYEWMLAVGAIVFSFAGRASADRVFSLARRFRHHRRTGQSAGELAGDRLHGG